MISVAQDRSDGYTRAIRDAGTIAGLKSAITDAPSLACFANSLDKRYGRELYHALVFDLGHTLKISVMEIEDGIFETLSQDEVQDFGG